jgi:hypothetical protein
MYLQRLLDYVCDNWQKKDEGIWEMRSEQRHFIFSKLMCWVALDRGLRLADKRSFPANRTRWLQNRDKIYKEIMQKGRNREKQAFVQSLGCGALDASNLIIWSLSNHSGRPRPNQSQSIRTDLRGIWPRLSIRWSPRRRCAQRLANPHAGG